LGKNEALTVGNGALTVSVSSKQNYVGVVPFDFIYLNLAEQSGAKPQPNEVKPKKGQVAFFISL